jgi:threonine aldolase
VNFLSDNTAPVAPDIVNAIVEANDGFAVGYGDDDWTRSVERRLSELFEREVAIFLVPTGTAANALALAHLTPPWGAVLCHIDSHVATDECGAPEFFGGGLKLVELPGDDWKITAETLKRFLADRFGHSPHQMIASVLSITQATEAGTIYRPKEIATLSEIAHERSFAVHMDGARFNEVKPSCSSTPHAPRSCPNAGSAPAISYPNIVSLLRNLGPFLRTTGGSRLHATTTSWPINSLPGSPLLAWRRFGR